MEVHDFDQEHLESALKDDDDHQQHNVASMTNPTVLQASAARHPRPTTGGQENNTSRERYSLLPDYAQESFVKTNGETSDAHSAAVSFQDLREDVEHELPKHIKTPVTKRARDMVRMTAVKCVSAPQMEVMLKVKQANNLEFSFLKPDNDCHAYYLWLKEQEENRIKQKETVEKAGGMDLLDMYSSSSDDDDDETAAKKDQLKSATAPSTKDSVEQPDHSQYTSASVTAADNTGSVKRPSDFADKHVDAATKARRLKRAKLMRGHYRLQLMEGESKPEAKR